MSSAPSVRLQIETKLANRVPAALTLKIKQAPELFPTGISEVDAILGGGVPRGSITEVAGAASTGKTSFGLSAIAAITQSGATEAAFGVLVLVQSFQIPCQLSKSKTDR
jgi:RecA/RadA recombinase